jgi:hypothetical protein
MLDSEVAGWLGKRGVRTSECLGKGLVRSAPPRILIPELGAILQTCHPAARGDPVPINANQGALWLSVTLRRL